MVDLHVNPDYKDFIEKVEKSQDDLIGQIVRPRESVHAIFKLAIGVLPPEMEGDGMGILAALNGAPQQQQNPANAQRKAAQKRMLAVYEQESVMD
jgi:hypothetical protein